MAWRWRRYTMLGARTGCRCAPRGRRAGEIIQATHLEMGMLPTVPAGVFWIDDIETAEADPTERLALARKYMPLPASFQEAATALRALIIARSRQLEDGSDLLSELYLTAARANFLLTTPYVPGVGPRYEVAASIPRHVWERLPMPYPAIGYSELAMLNRADRSWLVGAWGEPASHCSAREYHQSVWDEQVARYTGEKSRRR